MDWPTVALFIAMLGFLAFATVVLMIIKIIGWLTRSTVKTVTATASVFKIRR